MTTNTDDTANTATTSDQIPSLTPGVIPTGSGGTPTGFGGPSGQLTGIRSRTTHRGRTVILFGIGLLAAASVGILTAAALTSTPAPTAPAVVRPEPQTNNQREGRVPPGPPDTRNIREGRVSPQVEASVLARPQPSASARRNTAHPQHQ
jgi:hypothetical protein